MSRGRQSAHIQTGEPRNPRVRRTLPTLLTMLRMGGNLPSSSPRAAHRTYFALLSPDSLGVIAQFLLLRCRTQRERKSLPKLLLPEDSPLPYVLSKIFSTLELSSSVCWKSFVAVGGSDACAYIGLNLFQDQKCHRKILRELLPDVKQLRIRTDNFIDGRFVRFFSRAMVKHCVNLKALDIQIGVVPAGSPAIAVKIVTAIGNKLTTLAISNFSNITACYENLHSLVGSIARVCARLQCFEFSGHHADTLPPIYSALGRTLLSVKIVVLSTMNWQVTLESLHRNCRLLRSVHLDSGIMTAESYLVPSGALLDLLMSYGSQLESASLTCVTLDHIPLVLSACSEVRASVMYGERWSNTASCLSHLGALGSRVRVLSMDGLENAFSELVAPTMARCNRIEDMCIEDVHTNSGVKALFSAKHTRLHRIYLSLSNEKLEADTVISVANSTENLRKLDLRLIESGGTYSSELPKIARANKRIERFSLTEYGRRTLRSAVALVKDINEFMEYAPNLKRVDVKLIPSIRNGYVKWNDEIATLLLPYRNRKVSGCITYNYRYEF